jgi:hypothetical protein
MDGLTLNGRIVFVDEVALDELYGNAGLSDTTASDNYELVLAQELGRHLGCCGCGKGCCRLKRRREDDLGTPREAEARASLGTQQSRQARSRWRSGRSNGGRLQWPGDAVAVLKELGDFVVRLWLQNTASPIWARGPLGAFPWPPNRRTLHTSQAYAGCCRPSRRRVGVSTRDHTEVWCIAWPLCSTGNTQ